MPADPKYKPLILSKSEYRKFRLAIYSDRHEECEICTRWVDIESTGHIHHIIVRKVGGDVPDNVKLLCWECHGKVHTGEIKLTKES